MAVGIPAKKATFRFAQKFNGVVSVALGSDRLYVLYSSDEGAGKRFFKDFDLSHYDGVERDVPSYLNREAEARWRPMFLEGDLLYVYGDQPELIDVSQWQPKYSEYQGQAIRIGRSTAASPMTVRGSTGPLAGTITPKAWISSRATRSWITPISTSNILCLLATP